MAKFLYLFFIAALIALFLFKSSPQPQHFEAISQTVTVTWDSHGIPLIKASNLMDAYFVQGFLTARDRFFQMELTRRKMAGTLAELFGPKALSADVAQRRWNYSNVAQRAVNQMTPESRSYLEAFSRGVNESLSHEGRPWELKVLGLAPAPWKPEDCFLVVLSMYDSLNRQEEFQEEAVSLIKTRFSSSVAHFLTLDWGFLDSPIVPDPPLKLSTPPSEKDFKVLHKEAQSPKIPRDSEPGSNAWAMSGKLTASGKPLLASDPHLDLRVPNLWYRLGLQTETHQVYGVTIPGVPGVVIGRNDQVAWAFTNSAVDNVDQILISKTDPSLISRKELIAVKGEEPREFLFTDSPWGPVLSEDGADVIAVQWTALHPDNLKDLDLTPINSAKNVSELLWGFHHWAGPPQNAIFATQTGEIGWTLAGRIPKRKGFDGTSRTRRSSGVSWNGYLDPREVPVVLNPPEGFIVSANQRTVPPTRAYQPFGNDWPNPARAKRIHQLLSVSRKWKASDFLDIQNDTTSLTHLWYRDQLMQCPEDSLITEKKEPLRTAYALIREWDGQITLNSSAYPIMKQFRFSLFKNLIAPIAKTISLEKESILFSRLSNDFLLSQILRTQKRNFLPPPYTDYCNLLTQVFRETVEDLGFSAQNLHALHWGDLNQSHIQHPFSRTLPSWLQPLLNFPKKAMPGDYLVPNVMTPTNGASMRLVIDFDSPHNSLFSQPGGQSGSVFSAHYKDIYETWIEGRAVPFEANPNHEFTKELFLPE